MSQQLEINIPTPNGEYEQAELFVDNYRSMWRDAVLEATGTGLFVYISLAGVHQAVLSAVSSNSSVDEIHVAIGFAIGLASGVFVALKSGAHLNPAVSFTMWLTKNINLQRFLVYVAAQLFGAFIGSLLVLALYDSRINNLPENNALIGSFGTLKNPNNSLFSSILDQFVGSALLMIGIMKSPDSKWKPLFIGSVLGGLGLFQGTNGFAFNLARDFAPRLVSTFIYGQDPFTAENYWFWVPMVMSFVGIPFGYAVAKVI
jgi:aquaglyceroporin related protein